MRRALVAVALALVGLTGLETFFISQNTTDTPIAGNIAVLIIFNIIVILIFILLLLITRNFVKLYNERKSKILGSKFQTKLIIAFLILALFPSVFIFMVASKLFSYSIGNWFNFKIENSLEQSMNVAREYYSHMELNALRSAHKIEGFITRKGLYLEERRSDLNGLVSEKMNEYGLSAVILFDQNFKRVLTKTVRSLPEGIVDRDYTKLVKKSVEGESISETFTTLKNNYLVVAIPLTQKIGGDISVWGHIITLNHIPASTLVKIEGIRKAYEDYKQQNLLKQPVSANYYITFLMVTLLILFSAVWLGIYMARGITIPIQQLAEGTRKIAEGNFNFKIGIVANDEIGLLVNSFNEMTDEIKESRIKLQEANEGLKTSNIELERRRYYIATILENIGAGVVSIDKKGRITTVNPAAIQILKIQNKDLVGSSYKHIFDQTFHEPIRKKLRLMIRKKKEFMEEQIELPVGSNQITLHVNIRVLQDTLKRYLGLVIVFEDLTELIKAQKIAAWQEVAQGIAHEIKNPLTPIQLNTQRLRKKYYENKEDFARVFDDSIKIITQEVEGMKELLNEFLRFSRMPAPKPRPVSLTKIINDVVTLYADREEIRSLKKQFDPNITRMNLDQEQIRRVLINLFENSIDAIQEGGNIEITTRLMTKNKVVRIEFSDDGMGISSPDREKLFMPHFTTKKRGTGLGLAIVHRIIADHNGKIEVADNDPKGTVFRIDLPLTNSYETTSQHEESTASLT